MANEVDPGPRDPNRPQFNPLIPRPAVTLIALAIAATLIWHIVYDATHDDYDNAKLTMGLGIFVFFTFGADVTKWFRGGGS